MHQTAWDWHPRGCGSRFFRVGARMRVRASSTANTGLYPGPTHFAAPRLILLAFCVAFVGAPGFGAVPQNQNQTQNPPRRRRQVRRIFLTRHRPCNRRLLLSPNPEPENSPMIRVRNRLNPLPETGSSSDGGQSRQEKQPPPPDAAGRDGPSGSVPEDDQAPVRKTRLIRRDLYKISVTTNFVQIPVMVKDSKRRAGRRLASKDFTVNENGKPQTLTYFTSDPFALSVAVVLDLGMADMAVKR